jgi:protein-S-isoprenylcysteine O-methyltransferase Ste14
MALATIPFVVWAQRSLGGNVTKTVVTKQEHRLVMHGPYRWIRHPLYLAGAAFFVALGLMSASWYFFAVLLLGVLPLTLRTRMEEAALIERFGDEYREYMKCTGSLLPRIIG